MRGVHNSKFDFNSLSISINWLVFSVFEYTYLLFWNVFWSLCPVIAIGLFDRIAGKLPKLIVEIPY